MLSFTRPSTALEGTWRQPSRNSARARLGKISFALGRTTRAGNSASSSEANTATGPPKPTSSSSVAVRGRSAFRRSCLRAAPSWRTAGSKVGSSGSVNRSLAALETLLGGTQAVEERGGANLEEYPQEGARGYAGGGDERRPTDALGGYSHGPDRYGHSVGDAHERRTLQAEAVEDVLRPEGVAVPLRRGAGLRAKTGVPHDVGRIEAVALCQGQEPLQAGGVQCVVARQEDGGRSALGA